MITDQTVSVVLDKATVDVDVMSEEGEVSVLNRSTKYKSISDRALYFVCM
jgi:hypothetical protein